MNTSRPRAAGEALTSDEGTVDPRAWPMHVKVSK
jgi:hypothetical protein